MLKADAPTQRKLADTLSKILSPGGLKDIPTQEDLDEIKEYNNVQIRFAQKTEELQAQLSLNNEKGSLDTERKLLKIKVLPYQKISLKILTKYRR